MQEDAKSPNGAADDGFGRVPTYIITLAADYCSQCSDADFCALVEHDLYHIAQAFKVFWPCV